MTQLAPLPIVVPLLLAAVFSLLSGMLPRRLADAVALVASAANTVVCLVLARASAASPIVYWLGDWRPRLGVAPGIGLVIDPIGAGMAALVSLLMTAALSFSWHYFKSIKTLYHALMMGFLAGMCGLCLTGDLFNLFVWFELMTAAGIALCGYKSEEAGPLQGAINFAVSNTVGAFITLTGIALIYGRTGALNLAQVADALSRGPGDALVCTGFIFICVGFLTKAAVAPFHFWLADAHAVAPTPVCVLFSGVMVELGLYAVARIYFSAFAQALAPKAGLLQGLLLGLGTLTAVVGALMCVGQRHLKRLLAYSTISHVGLMTVALGLLEPAALGGLALYVVGHGLLKGALFIASGILLHRHGTLDEGELRGQGRGHALLGGVFALGGLGLAGLPGLANFWGEVFIDHSAKHLGHEWIGYLFIVCGALTGGAVLRAAAGVFLGWGRADKPAWSGAQKLEDEHETDSDHGHLPWSMGATPVALLALTIALGALAPARPAFLRHALRLRDTASFREVVLRRQALEPAPRRELATIADAPAGPTVVHGAVAVLAAFLMAWLSSVPFRVTEPLWAGIRGLRRVHSGRIGDYIAWLTMGVAILTGVFTWL